jgi:hypothetical protein
LSAWPFILFSIVFVGLVCAHFLPSYRAWVRTRGEHPADIDPNYVRIEDYFARSFRLKMSEWLKLPVHETRADGTKIIIKGDERIRVSGPCDYPSKSESDEILAVDGDFRCGTDCLFHREIHVRGNAVVGAGTRLQSIAVDGNLLLASGVAVTRWADSTGEMKIGSGAVVRARATSGTLIEIAGGAVVGSAFAPMVSTSGGGLDCETSAAEVQISRIELPGAARASSAGGARKRQWLDPGRMHKISHDSWLYLGSLVPPMPLHVKANLIVRGDCILPAGSLVERHLKARGRIEMKEGSVCSGNVVAEGDIFFEQSCRFRGVVHTGRTLRLGRGVIGGEEGKKVSAYAAGILTLEDGVTVYGKVSSGDRVVAATRE